MKYIKQINEFWGDVLKRDLLGETREEDKFHSKEQLIEYLESEIKKQGKNVVIQNLDVSLIEDLSELFRDIADEVESLNLSGWKTSGVKDMSEMFKWLDGLKSLDVSGWDTSNVENMNSMFYFCRRLKSLDLSDWNTSNVRDILGMFHCCLSLKSLNLPEWDTSRAKDMGNMFQKCPAPYEVINHKIVKK